MVVVSCRAGEGCTRAAGLDVGSLSAGGAGTESMFMTWRAWWRGPRDCGIKLRARIYPHGRQKRGPEPHGAALARQAASRLDSLRRAPGRAGPQAEGRRARRPIWPMRAGASCAFSPGGESHGAPARAWCRWRATRAVKRRWSCGLLLQACLVYKISPAPTLCANFVARQKFTQPECRTAINTSLPDQSAPRATFGLRSDPTPPPTTSSLHELRPVKPT